MKLVGVRLFTYSFALQIIKIVLLAVYLGSKQFLVCTKLKISALGKNIQRSSQKVSFIGCVSIGFAFSEKNQISHLYFWCK